MSSRDKKLNRSDVRVGIWKFILSFFILSGVTFCAVFFFFKSYELQRKGIEKEVKDYEGLLGRSAALKIQVDDIYSKMTTLDLRNVENDIALRNQIANNVRDAKNIIGKDSATSLAEYNVLLKKIAPMLTLKSKIIDYNSKKQVAIQNLNQCMDQTQILVRELQKDDTRRYNGGRR